MRTLVLTALLIALACLWLNASAEGAASTRVPLHAKGLKSPGTYNFGHIPIAQGARQARIEIDKLDLEGNVTTEIELYMEISLDGGNTWPLWARGIKEPGDITPAEALEPAYVGRFIDPSIPHQVRGSVIIRNTAANIGSDIVYEE